MNRTLHNFVIYGIGARETEEVSTVNKTREVD